MALMVGAAAPSRAQTFQINSSPGDVVITGTFTRVTVASATVSVGGSVINNGNIQAPLFTNGAVILNQGTLVGGLTNSGTIGAPASTAAIIVISSASVVGGISNAGTGTITAGGNGIQLAGTGDSISGSLSVFSGGITNSGSIAAGATGIALGGGFGTLTFAVSTFSGGITNSGTISAGSGGIALFGSSTFSGGITNSGTITLAGSESESRSGGSGIGISVQSVSAFSGNIANSGTLTATSGTAIAVSNVSTFNGNISNSGTIQSSQRTGISLSNVQTFNGNISNSGTISANNTGISVFNISSAFTGGITNSGTITGGTSRTGIFIVNVSSFAGGVSNSGLISGGFAGLTIGTTDGARGVSTFSGGITNSGTILGNNFGVELNSTPNFSGVIANSGTISSGGTAISVFNTPSVSIFDSGTITGGTAIRFDSGVNTLTLGPGFSITGGVLGAGTDIFQLGGSGTGNFNLDTLGVQYTGFSTFNVVSATWITTGTSTQNWTIFPSATLQLGNGGTSGAINGNVADNGVFAVDRSDTYSFTGTIAGTGSFQQLGTGTTVLAAANAYEGGTTISAGTLQVTNNSSVGSGPVTLDGGTFQTANAGLAFANSFVLNTTGGTIDTQAFTLNLSGGISNGNGAGGFTKIGAGTLVLSGASSYTGPTTINAGAVQAGAANVFAPASAFTVGSGAVLDLNNFNQAIGSLAGPGNVTLGSATLTTGGDGTSTTYSGTISGTGGLTKIGGGTLTLTGVNGYTGGTTLAGGGLALGNNSALGPGSLTMSGGAALQATSASVTVPNAIVLGGAGTFDSQNNVFQLSGNITGGGSLTKIGSGFLILSGANSYTGGTTVSGGTLLGSTVSLPGNIVDNAALVFEQPSPGTYSGSLSGSGTLTVHGAGLVTLTGNSSAFAGETRLAAGSLEVGTAATPGASLGGTIDIFDGGVLSGHGTVASVNNFGGTVAPGGTIGTLTVTGNYTQSSSGVLAIEVSPSTSSQLKVGGAVSLAGTLALTYDPGTYKPTAYTFITAPTITGGFDAVTIAGSAPGLSQGLAFDPKTGQLVLGGTLVVAPTNDTVFPAMTSSLVQNAQQATSIVLDRIVSRLGITGEAPALSAALSAPAGPQFAQLGNGNLTAIQGVATELPNLVTERGGWFRGIGSFGSVNGSSTAPGFVYQSGGFLAGFDQEVMPNVFAGFAGGYTRSDVGVHGASSGDIDTARIMGYGGGLAGSAVWSVTAGYAHDNISTSRSFAGGVTAHESHGTNELTLGAQWSLPFQFADATIVPQAGARLVSLFGDGFVETGAAGNNLTGQSDSLTSVQPFIGAVASRNFVTDGGLRLTPLVQIGYAREVADNSRLVNVNTLDGTAFRVEGVRPSRDILTAGAGLTARAQDNLYVFADYNATLPTGNTVNQTFSVGLKLLFPPTSAAPESSEPPLYLGPDAQPDRPQLLARQQELFGQSFRDPGNVNVILDYATVSARLGDNEAAAEALERLLLFNPKLPSVETELGVLYYRMGSFKAAQAYLDTARTLNPSPLEQARIEEYSLKIAAAQQTHAFSGTFELGTQYQTDANIGPGSPLIHSPVGDVLLNNQFVKHDDTSFFAAGSFLYNYDLGTQNGDGFEVAGTAYGNHFLQFNRLDLDFGEVTAGPRLRFPGLNAGPVQWVTVKPYAILNEVGLGEDQYFWTYGGGLEGTALLWDDMSAKLAFEHREKSFTNAPSRPLSTGLDGNDNLVQLVLQKPVTGNSFLVGEFDYLDQSTKFAYYTNNTYAVSAAYHISYADPIRLLNRPWETVFFGSRSWSIYAAPDPCCNTGGNPASFSGSARDDRHWRFGVGQTFQVTGNTALTLQLQRDIVSSNLPIYGYSSDSVVADLKVRF